LVAGDFLDRSEYDDDDDDDDDDGDVIVTEPDLILLSTSGSSLAISASMLNDETTRLASVDVDDDWRWVSMVAAIIADNEFASCRCAVIYNSR